MPERFNVSVPPVANDIYRRAVPATKYLPERLSAAFPQHYAPADDHITAGQSERGEVARCGSPALKPTTTGRTHGAVRLSVVSVRIITL